MPSERVFYSLPRWRLTRWLAEVGPDASDDIREALIAQLYGSLPVFAAGAVNSVAVAGVIALRKPTALFVTWFIIELVICLSRLVVLVVAHRAARAGRPTPTDLLLLLAIAWSASVGFGVFAGMASADWVIATLACLSSAAMVGGICFRNFGAPRLAGAMILLSLGPIIPGVALGGEPLLYIAFLQVPMYLAAMSEAAFRLNRMLITTMRAERINGHLANHDALTGLLNRAGFIDALGAGLRASRSGDRKHLAVLFVDLDDFKPVNDTFGHAAGDIILKEVAARLSRILPVRSAIARMGGDEFVVLADHTNADQALEIGRRIIDEIATPYQLDGGLSTSVGASIGIAISPDHGTEVGELLAVADAALYEAKSSGKSRCCLASLETNLAALRRLRGDIRAKVAA
ncbi:MAG: GGDEF domain-containing protein [Bradyrhizobium sp.]